MNGCGILPKSIIPTSSIDRITRGYHAEDKIVMDRVLRRVGIDPAEIEMIIFKRDAERFAKRMEIYKTYNQKQYGKLEQLLQEYEKGNSRNASNSSTVCKENACMDDDSTK